MTTRRNVLTLIGLGAVSAAAGCGLTRSSAGAVVVAVPDKLLAAVAGGGIALVGGTVVRSLGDAIATPDGLRILHAEVAGTGTRVVTMSSETGEVLATRIISGRWAPRVASRDGGYIALTSPDRGGTTGYAPSAQARSPIAVLAPSGPAQVLDLGGNYVPDALSAAGSMFVLDWLPSNAPDHYRVRQLDLATRALTPLLTRSKVPVPAGDEEEMRGEGRMAAFSPDLTVLYTLYTNQPGHEHTRNLIAGTHDTASAFVHTLQLDQAWAYCVDLPAPFGHGPAAGHAIATAPDGAVFVADITSGRVASVDPDSLTVTRVTDIPAGTGTGCAVATDAYLFVGAGSAVHVIARSGMAAVARWPVGGVIRGLAVSADARLLYIGMPGRVAWLDAQTGQVQGAVAVPGLSGLLRRL